MGDWIFPSFTSPPHNNRTVATPHAETPRRGFQETFHRNVSTAEQREGRKAPPPPTYCHRTHANTRHVYATRPLWANKKRIFPLTLGLLRCYASMLGGLRWLMINCATIRQLSLKKRDDNRANRAHPNRRCLRRGASGALPGFAHQNRWRTGTARTQRITEENQETNRCSTTVWRDDPRING